MLPACLRPSHREHRPGWKPSLFSTDSFWLRWCASVLCFLAVGGNAAEEKKPEPKPLPSVILTSPLAAVAGATNTILLRGLSLTNVSEVRFLAPPVGLVSLIKSATKSDPPKPLDAKRAGDNLIVLSLALPPVVEAAGLSYVVISPDGASATNTLVVLPADQAVSEKEPNGGFKEAQTITMGRTVLGEIGKEKDVDVFRFDGAAGHRIHVEITAARLGSALDALVNLYDASGHLIASSDDPPPGRDAVLDATLPTPGPWFLVVLDAHDRGGAAHPYLLSLKLAK